MSQTLAGMDVWIAGWMPTWIEGLFCVVWS